jgi:hypothetical protein
MYDVVDFRHVNGDGFVMLSGDFGEKRNGSAAAGDGEGR